MADINNFTIHGRTWDNPDPQRNWMWNVTFNGIGAIVPNIMTTFGGGSNNVNMVTEEDLKVRCKSLSIPPRDNEEISSNFMSTKRWWPGRPIVDGTMNMTFEDTVDQRIKQIFHIWNQKIINVSPDGANFIAELGQPGQSSYLRHEYEVCDVFIELKHVNGQNLRHKIILVNCWPKTINEVPLTYTDNAFVIYTVTFRYDYHLLNYNGVSW